ncbi:MATE family efflux transporter [Gordonibacter massiliensis (ex Traore et al. 2017)]|uniref:MATE family efflux transporter n=1 Tax=Gordonibacter massiliensis (ex Traore et al. 2017) TaxID=1841863 RepID=UPI001C8B415F
MPQPKQRQIDLVNEPIGSALARLALPIMASAFLATAYNITDMAWIGLLGSNAVAAVGVAGMYTWLASAIVVMARMGGQVNMAQALGNRRPDEAVQYARGALQLAVGLALAFSAVTLAFADGLVGILVPDDPRVAQEAALYLRLCGGFVLFIYLSQTLTGLLTAQGDSKTPFKANAAGLVVNMALDPLLILGFGPVPQLGVLGAAVATVFAQLVVAGLMIVGIVRDRGAANVLRRVRPLQPTKAVHLSRIVRIGLPAAIQSALYAVISMVLTRMVAAWGSGAVAVQRVGGQIESLTWCTAEAAGSALNAFAAQNFGARRPERIRRGYRLAFAAVGAWALAVSALFVFLPGPISWVFFHEPDVVGISSSYLFVIGIGEAFMCIELMTVGALSGLGKTRLCSIISVALTGSRIPLALLLSSTPLGLDGVWWALTLTSIAKGVVFWAVFRHVARKLPEGRTQAVVANGEGEPGLA